MALTKLPKNAIGTGAVKANNIADGTIQNTDISGSLTNDKLANSSFTFNGTEVSLGASTSVITYLDWQAVSVADGSTQVTAEAGKGYFLDTNAGVIEVFLPSSPTRGDVVGLVDYAGTFGTNQLIINTGGVNIDSTVGSEFKVTTNNAIVECVYVDSAKGWLVYLNQAAGTTPTVTGNELGGGYDTKTFILATGGTITTSGDYKIHTFTGDGCFVVSAEGAGTPTQPNTVDYLVVAGGGGGGHDNGGGGGAGGFRISSGAASGCYTRSPLGACVSGISLSATTYPIVVGAGGSGATCGPIGGGDGSNSSFSIITSTGGGGGAATGRPGGSGGGSCVPGNPAGTGNTPPVSPPQGNNGAPRTQGAPSYGGGGGGGAGAAGTSPTGPTAGSGGDGSYSNINPSTGVADGPVPGARYYAGGGASQGQGGTMGTGGAGGGAGAGGPTHNAVGGTANTGGGGEGGRGCGPPVCGGAGGKGIVILRYKYQ